MNMAWKGKYDYAKYQEQGGFVLPVLCVWRCDFDPESFLDALASYWNAYFALNCTGIVFSVLKFFSQKSKVRIQVWAQLEGSQH